MIPASLRRIHYLIDIGVILGTLFGVLGTYWDIQHHILAGRESFWIPPHLMVYAGVLFVLISSGIGLWSAHHMRHTRRMRHFSVAILMILLSVFLQVLLAPVDDLWHRLFGIDVTVWSPPHLLLLFAGTCISLGFIYFERLYLHLETHERKAVSRGEFFILTLMFAIALIGLSIIVAEFEFTRAIPLTHESQARNPLWYYVLLGGSALFLFALAKTLVRARWIATWIAVLYLMLRLLGQYVLLDVHAWPMLPLAVLPAAVVIDILYWRNTFVRIMALLAGAVIFVYAQSAYVAYLDVERFVLGNGALMSSAIAALLGGMVGVFVGSVMLRHAQQS